MIWNILLQKAVQSIPMFKKPDKTVPVSQEIPLETFMKKASEKWLTDEEIDIAYNELRKQWKEVVWYNEIQDEYIKTKINQQQGDVPENEEIEQETLEQPKEEEWFLSKVWWAVKSVWKWVGEAVVGGISALPEISWWIWWAIGKWLWKVLPWKVWEAFTKAWEETQQDLSSFAQDLRSTLWVEEETIPSKIWKGITTAWVSLIPITKAWAIIDKWTKLVSKIPKLWNIAWFITKAWADWAAITAKMKLYEGNIPTTDDLESWAWLWIALWAWWKLLEQVWKSIFWLTIRPNTEQAKKIIKAWIKWKTIPETIPQTALDKWVFGTARWVSIKAGKEADKLWKTKVNPLLEKTQQQTNLDDSFWKLSKFIDDTVEPAEKEAYTKAFNKLYGDYTKEYWATVPLKNIQDIKSRLDSSISKAARDNKTGSPINVLKWQLADLFRSDLHSKLSQEFWKDTAKLYAQYNNLKSLIPFGEKQITQWLRWVGGAWTTLWSLTDILLTPISTSAWQTLYRIWQLMNTNWKPMMVVWKQWLKTLKDLSSKQLEWSE